MYLYLFTSTGWKFICTVCSTVSINNRKNEQIDPDQSDLGPFCMDMLFLSQMFLCFGFTPLSGPFEPP